MYDRLDSHNLDIAQLAQRDVLLGEGPAEKRQTCGNDGKNV